MDNSNFKTRAPEVVSISSHVARGSVGNRAMVFALETMGFNVWSVPTVILPWHPGHGPAGRITIDNVQFKTLLTDLSSSKFAPQVGTIISGYMGSVEQVIATADFIRDLRRKNGDVLYVCDPVIGDAAGLYVPIEIANAIRDQLLPLADLITPNRFEFGWLFGCEHENNDGLIAAFKRTELQQALITSACSFLKNGIGNLYIDHKSAYLCEHPIRENAPNGTGDLTTALFTAHLLRGADIKTALEQTTKSIFEILMTATARKAEELPLELAARSILQPQAAVHMREIANKLAFRKAPKRKV